MVKKTLKWTDTHIKLKTTMFNYLSQKSTKPLNEDTFIYDKRRDFSKIIEGNTKWGDSQKEGFFFMIS